MRVFDFDNTLYDGETIMDIFLYFLKKDTKNIIKYAPMFIRDFVRYKFDKITVDEALESYGQAFKDYCLSYDNIYDEFELFWDKHQNKLKGFYSDIRDDEDIILSGCPYCLLKIICDRVGIKHYIGSDVDPIKGEIKTVCYKERKLDVFRSIYGDVIIDEFYTDSMADKPMMDISRNVYMVKGEKITQIKKDGVAI